MDTHTSMSNIHTQKHLVLRLVTKHQTCVERCVLAAWPSQVRARPRPLLPRPDPPWLSRDLAVALLLPPCAAGFAAFARASLGTAQMKPTQQRTRQSLSTRRRVTAVETCTSCKHIWSLTFDALSVDKHRQKPLVSTRELSIRARSRKKSKLPLTSLAYGPAPETHQRP